MTSLRLPLLLAALCLAAGDVQAQGFFERLFGLTPSRPPPPAAAYPGPQPVRPELPYDDTPRSRPAAPPPMARPVAIRPPSEETVLGRDLRQNGASGNLRIERTPRGDLRARVTVVGRKIARPTETCSTGIASGEMTALVSLGRPEGTPRYQLQDPTCPLQLDLLDEAVLIKGPAEICTFTAADCQADPGGMWGPEPGQLVGRAASYEQTRGSVDRAVRENYKVLTQRAKPEGIRPIVAEQAAFSADRETVCRAYAREAAHSFCNAKFTEARALALGSRLGVTTTASTTSDSRSRRRNPDPSGLPATDEIMQRRPGDPDDD